MAGRITAWRWHARHSTPGDYSSVVIPLDQAHLHSHSARCGRTEFEEHGLGSDDDDDDPKIVGENDGVHDGDGNENDEGAGMLPMSAAEYSIEGLRKEVRRGGGGLRSEYESEWSILLLILYPFLRITLSA